MGLPHRRMYFDLNMSFFPLSMEIASLLDAIVSFQNYSNDLLVGLSAPRADSFLLVLSNSADQTLVSSRLGL